MPWLQILGDQFLVFMKCRGLYVEMLFPLLSFNKGLGCPVRTSSKQQKHIQPNCALHLWRSSRLRSEGILEGPSFCILKEGNGSTKSSACTSLVRLILRFGRRAWLVVLLFITNI
jgi:hypothetical protein